MKPDENPDAGIKVLISMTIRDRDKIDQKARQLGISRSELIRRACARFEEPSYENEEW